MNTRHPPKLPSSSSRTVRWIVRSIWGLFALALILIMGVGILLGTSPGLELIRQVAVSAGSSFLNGQLDIKRIEGQAFSTLWIHNLTIYDDTHLDAVHVDKIKLSWRPMALVWGQVIINEVDIEGPTINLVESSTASLNLARLVPPAQDSPPPPPSSDEPLNLPFIKLNKFAIQGGSVRYIKDELETHTIKDFGLLLNLYGQGDELNIVLSRLSTQFQDGIPIELSIEAQLKDQWLNVKSILATIDEGKISAQDIYAPLSIDKPLTHSPKAALSINMPARSIHRLGGPSELLADLDLTLTATSGPPSSPISLAIQGSAGPTVLHSQGHLVLDHQQFDLDLRLKHINPSQLWEGLPRAKLDVDLTANGVALAPRVDGQLRISGWIQPPDGSRPAPEKPTETRSYPRRVLLKPITLRGQWTGEQASIQANGQLNTTLKSLSKPKPRGRRKHRRLAEAQPKSVSTHRDQTTSFKAQAVLTQLTSSTPEIKRGRISVTIPSLQPLIGPQASGQVTLTAAIKGPIDNFIARGGLNVHNLRLSSDLQLKKTRIQWDLRGLPLTPKGKAEADVDALKLGERTLESVRATLTANSQNQTLKLHLPRLRVQTGALQWKGDGLRVTRTPNGALKITDIQLKSPAGALNAQLRLSDPDVSKARIFADVALKRLRLKKLPRSLLPELQDLSGQVELNLHAEGPLTQPTAELEMETTVRLAPDKPAISTQLLASIKPETLKAQIHLKGLAQKSELRVLSPLPKNLTDSRAWSKVIARGPITHLDLIIDDLNLETAQAFAGLRPTAKGLTSLEAHIRKRGKRAMVQLKAPQIYLDALALDEPSRYGAEISLNTTAQFIPGKLTITSELDGPATGKSEYASTIIAPKNIFAMEAWSKLGFSALQQANVHFRQLKLDALNKLKIVDGLSGELTADIDKLSPSAPLAGRLSTRNLRGPWMDGLWNGDLNLNLGQKLSTQLAVQLDSQDVFNARFNAPLSIDSLLVSTQQQIAQTPIDGTISIQQFGLKKVLPQKSPFKRLIKGQLEADGQVKGTIKHPKGRLQVAVRDLEIAKQPFQTAEFTGQIERQDIDLSGLIAAGDQQKIVIKAQSRGQATQQTVKARVNAEGFPLGFLSNLGVLPVGLEGAFFGDVQVDGQLATARPTGWVEVRDMRLVFAQSALEPLRDGLARVEFTPKQARLKFDAVAPGGKMNVLTRIDLPVAGTENPTKIQGTTQLQKFPINAGQRARIDLNVDISGVITADAKTRLDIELYDGYITLPEEQTRALHPVGAPTEVEFVEALQDPSDEAEKPSPPSPPMAVSVKTREPIDIRGGPVDARLNLNVSSRTAMPTENGVRGRVWISDGTITLFERDYTIRRTELTLDGEEPPNPRLDITLQHEFLDEGLRFMVRVTGRADKPIVEFSSAPARFSDGELLLIFTGADPSEIGRDAEPGSGEGSAAANAAAGFLAGQLQSELGRALPLDTLKIDLDENQAPSFTLGKWITRQIFLAFRYNTAAEGQEAVVQYRFLPGWMVELVLGREQGQVSQAVDLLWLKQF